MKDDIQIFDLPDGGCSVTLDGETYRYSEDDVNEMKQDYISASERIANERKVTTQ